MVSQKSLIAFVSRLVDMEECQGYEQYWCFLKHKMAAVGMERRRPPTPPRASSPERRLGLAHVNRDLTICWP